MKLQFFAASFILLTLFGIAFAQQVNLDRLIPVMERDRNAAINRAEILEAQLAQLQDDMKKLQECQPKDQK